MKDTTKFGRVWENYHRKNERKRFFGDCRQNILTGAFMLSFILGISYIVFGLTAIPVLYLNTLP